MPDPEMQLAIDFGRYLEDTSFKISKGVFANRFLPEEGVNYDSLQYLFSLNSSGDKRKGRHPKIATIIHAKVENKNVCLKLSFNSLPRLASTNKTPINIVTDADDKKVLFCPPYINWTKNGTIMNIPNIIRRIPIAKKTVLLLFIFDVGGYLKIFEIQHNKTLLYLYFTYEI